MGVWRSEAEEVGRLLRAANMLLADGVAVGEAACRPNAAQQTWLG